YQLHKRVPRFRASCILFFQRLLNLDRHGTSKLQQLPGVDEPGIKRKIRKRRESSKNPGRFEILRYLGGRLSATQR
ncbi:hypothetical protein L9F63_014871, partial [Diploptera punctata]